MNLPHYFELRNVPEGVTNATLEPFEIERFLNYQMINNSELTAFNDLPIADPGNRWAKAKWADFEGVPLPLIIQSINLRGKTGWFHVPARFDAEQTKRLVDYLIESCVKKPIIQYSNEDWNLQFTHVKWIQEQLTEEHLALWTFPGGVDVPMATAKWVARRTEEIKGFAGNAAYVALCGQFMNPKVTAELIRAIDPNGFDLFAVAPYVGAFQRATNEEAAERLLSSLFSELSTVAQMTAAHRKELPVGKYLVAYEGGLHLLPRIWQTNQTGFEFERKTFQKFNRSDQAGYVSQQLIITCAAEGFDLWVPYSLATTYEQWDGTPTSHFFGHCEVIKGGKGLTRLPKFFQVAGAIMAHSLQQFNEPKNRE